MKYRHGRQLECSKCLVSEACTRILTKSLTMKLSISRCLAATVVLILIAAIVLGQIQQSTWWAGYDVLNCPGCGPVIDWSIEKSRDIVTDTQRRDFAKDGVLVLPSAISAAKVAELSDEVDAMADTFLTTVLAKLVLRQYSKYEHKLDTRSELVRDWAVHGPLGTWAAQLMGAKEARLYNAEKIYSSGANNPMGCNSAWHRDTVAAPFPTGAKSVTINVYLDDISSNPPTGDALVYIKGSHADLDAPPAVTGDNLFEPGLRVGDVLVHNAHIFHSPSGRGCWNRRSLQFRYVESPAVFTFGPNRFPHGPIPWTYAHAPGVAPHGLEEGQALEGPWYPKVFPKPSASEHVPFDDKPWGIIGVLGVAKQAQDLAAKLGIGNRENCTAGGVRGGLYFGFDGPVSECRDWEMASGLPVHKDGQMINNIKRMMGKAEA